MKSENYQPRNQKTDGFTIVELLIVIVVIAILAAITIVAYSNIQNRARVSSVTADLSQATRSLERVKISDTVYPGVLPFTSSGTTLTYNVSSTGTSFCLEAAKGSIVYSTTNADLTPKEAPCSRNGLVGWWDLNDGVADTLGNGNDGVLSTATPTPGANGRANGAYTFTANSGTRITLPRPKDYTDLPQTGFSISAWLKTTSTAGQQAAFSTAGSGNGVRFGHSNGKPYFLVGNGSFRETFFTSAPSINDGQWHHVLMTFDNQGAGYVIKAFVDGSQVGVENSTVTAVGSGNVSLIGAMSGSSSSAFSGSIDDVRIYGRSLTTSEASSVYTQGAQ